MYNLKLRLDAQTGEMVNSHCECASGKGPHGTCKHTAAMMRLLITFVEEGTSNVAKSCTEELQSHHVPSKFYTGKCFMYVIV